MSESPTSSSRIPSLDGIRALAIILVCVGHFAYNAGFRWWTDLYAHYGVRIFLVLSGFLITTLLKREREETGTINLKRFFIRRAYRILPAAYAYMILVSIVFGDSFTSKDLFVTFTYLSSYFHLPWLLSHLWSLSVEEQFYLLWPAAMALGIMLARRFAFGAIVFAPVFQFAMAKIGLALAAFYCFPSVADSLAAGCLLAIYQTKLEKYRSFFAWRGFPFDLGANIVLSLSAALPLSLEVLAIAPTASGFCADTFFCRCCSLHSECNRCASQDSEYAVCSVARDHKLQSLSLANAVRQPRSAILVHSFSSKSRTRSAGGYRFVLCNRAACLKTARTSCRSHPNKTTASLSSLCQCVGGSCERRRLTD